MVYKLTTTKGILFTVSQPKLQPKGARIEGYIQMRSYEVKTEAISITAAYGETYTEAKVIRYDRLIHIEEILNFPSYVHMNRAQTKTKIDELIKIVNQ